MIRHILFFLPAFMIVGTVFSVTPVTTAEGSRIFPNILPGKIIQIQKTYDPETKQVGLTSNSPYVKSPADLVRLENEEWQALRGRYGSLDESLWKKYDSMSDGDSLKVRLTSRMPQGIRYLNKYEHGEEELKEQSRQIAMVQPIRDIGSILSSSEIVNFDKYDASSAVATVSKRKLREMLAHADITNIGPNVGYYPTTFIPGKTLPLFFGQVTTPVSSLAASAYNHSQTAPPANPGTAIKIATFEAGLSSTFLTCAGLSPTVWQAFSGGDLIHSELTFRCLTYANRNGSYHHRNNYIYDDVAGQNFIINNDIRVTSSSTRRDGFISPGSQHPLTATAPEFLIMDDFGYRWPYTLFVNPTANEGYTLESHWQGYNGISVGNIRHSSYSTFELGEWGGATITRNPEQRYGGSCLRGTNDPSGVYSYCSSDREMPMIVAPGWSPTRFLNLPPDTSGYGTFMTDPCITGNFSWGTSFSAPTLSGMAANVISANTSQMASYPEKVRAVLLATAENVIGNEWTKNEDGIDGAGVVNGSSALSLSANHTPVSINSTAVERGVGSGSISTADWNTSLVYNIKVPNPRPSGQHLRVVLSWFSNPVVGGGVNALSDLDLNWNGPGSYYSSSWNSSIEIIDVARGDLTDGASHSVTVSKFVDRIPTGARANFFYYAIAWTWVDDHAP